MSRLKFIIAIANIFIFTISSLLFIKMNNDHFECSTITDSHINKNGEQIAINKHICKEKFNF